MRLDSTLDVFYVLSSLWGGPTSPLVCRSSAPEPNAVREAASRPEPSTAAAVTAFMDVSVVPMDTERVLANQTVVVEGGRITALGPSGQVTIPAGAVRIDGRGQYLMPGLGIMHDHFTRFFYDKEIPPQSLQEMPSYVSRAPDGTVRGSPWLVSRMATHLAAGITSLGTHPSGPEPEVSVAGLPVVRQFLEELPGPRVYVARNLGASQWSDSVAARIASAKAIGYDHFSFDGVGRPPQVTVDSLVAAARRAGLPLTAHWHGIPFYVTLALGGAGGSVDHLYAIYDGLASRGDRSPEQLQALAATLRQAGTWITPNLSCVTAGSPLSPSHPYARTLKALHEAGVKLLLSKDDGHYAYDELTAFVEAGFTPYQALVTGTRNIAEYFGRLNELGTVAVGKEADLLLLGANPLADIRATLEPVGVMIRGHWLDRAALDRRLLASPARWLDGGILRSRKGIGYWLSKGAGSTHRVKLTSLVDSLEQATANKAEYERLARRFAAALGALRASMPERQHLKWLDPDARAWMREQARRGLTVVVPGVPPTPKLEAGGS